ncbi:MAG: hypothetical protein ABUT20_56995 [Bacteroidota bacterium]
MVKKNLSVILVILMTIILVAMVVWLFNKRIERLEKGKRGQAGMTEKANIPASQHCTLNWQQTNFIL